MFLTSMTAASQLILTRQLGVSRRMLSTPTPVRSILIGELLGRFAIAMVQGLFIVLVSSLVFGVSWGDPAVRRRVIVLFALVGTGAAMTVGVFARQRRPGQRARAWCWACCWARWAAPWCRWSSSGADVGAGAA